MSAMGCFETAGERSHLAMSDSKPRSSEAVYSEVVRSARTFTSMVQRYDRQVS
jgi:hypothetical protein